MKTRILSLVLLACSIGITTSNSTGATDNSISADRDFAEFKTANVFLLASTPTLTSPINGLTGITVEPDFSWNDVPDETSYELRISTAGSSQAAFDAAVVFTDLAIPQNTASVSYSEISEDEANPGTFPFPLNNNTVYYWQVTAKGTPDANSAISHFTTIGAVNVTLADPSDGVTIAATSKTFSWNTDTQVGTMKFKIQLAEQGTVPTAAQWAAATSAITTDLSHELTLILGKDYYWRVVVLNSSNEVISYSSASSFNTSGGEDVTVHQTWPTEGVNVYTNSPTVYWYVSDITTGLQYKVWYGTVNDSDADDRIDDEAGVQSTAFTSNLKIELPGLDPGTTYYWQVESYYSATGKSTWSAIESFLTGGSGTLSEPFPSYPIDDVTVYTTAPTLYWYLAGSADGLTFDVYYREQGGVWSGVLHQSTELFYQLTNLTPNTTYEWKVASNNATATMESDVETFYVTGGVANGYTVATFPLDNVTTYTTTPTLNWYLEGSSLGITKYTVKWYRGSSAPAGGWTGYTPGGNSAAGGTFDVTPLTTTSFELPVDLTYGEKYYWAVASWDGTYSAWSEGSFTLIGGLSSQVPELSGPADGSTIPDRNTTLNWFINGTTAGITGYEVTYSLSDVFAAGATTVVGPGGQTTLTLDIANLTPGGTYHWKVRSYNGTDFSDYSATWTFTVDPGALSVQPFIGGPNNVDVSTISPQLSWLLPVQSQSVLTYNLEVADNPEFANAQVYNGLANSYQDLSELEPGVEYFWRVNSETQLGDVSNYSSFGSFGVAASVTDVGDNNVPVEFFVEQNYPNPFNPSTTITIKLPEAERVSLVIYDMLGREVKTLINGEINAGTHQVMWDGSNNFGNKVNSGIYIYRVVSSKYFVVRKMTLLK